MNVNDKFTNLTYLNLLLIKDIFKKKQKDDIINIVSNDKKYENLTEMIILFLKDIYDKKYHHAIFNEYIKQCIYNKLMNNKSDEYSIYRTPLQVLKNTKQMEYLKTVPQPAQRTKEWYEFRRKRLTASDVGTALGKNPYSSIKKLLLKKCGVEDAFRTNKACQHGIKYEDVTIQIYEKRKSCKIVEYGCIAHPTIEYLGASPDGITDNGIMIEIKNPFSRTIIGLPQEYYWIQMQIQLEVCNLDICQFVETTIKEYSTKIEFLNDCIQDIEYNQMMLTNTGLEKGICIEIINKKTKEISYQYSSLNLLKNNIDNWINDSIKCYNQTIYKINIQYWYLVIWSDITISRDKRWFSNNLSKLTDFWNQVIEYRKDDKYKTLIKPKKKKITKYNQGDCMIMSD